ncbi:hypothetical protein ACIOZM_19020 [Pseudomonas sp. NPDC087346]|uniref:hypothetical protein n=1 Tax=Pseudomonas sp. NPDC087346 TaxID=3364438 RepID=UPI0038128D7C
MIKQKSWGDCGVAVLANAMCDTYENTLKRLNGRDTGLTMQEMCAAILGKFNSIPIYVPLIGFNLESGIHDACTLTFDAAHKNIMSVQGRRAIYQVKTKSGMLHFIYFDGQKLFDPSTRAPENPVFSDYVYVVDAIFLLDVQH